MAKVLYIGQNWVTKQIECQQLFDDSEEEALIWAIGNDDNNRFWTEFPMLKSYVGDERVNYQKQSLDELLDATDGDSFSYLDAVYITETEPSALDRLLEKLLKVGFKGPIILGSTWQVYGWKKKKRIPIEEIERELLPETEYGKKMLELEKIMLKHGKGKALQTIVLRYSELFGPYMPENHHIVAMLIDAFSGDYIIIDPPQARNYDWLHVKYVYTLVPKLFTKKFIGGGEIYNVGSGSERKIGWLANAMIKLFDSPARVRYLSPPENSPLWEPRGYHSQLDIHKAKTFLGFDPDGISVQFFLETARWCEYHLDKSEGRRTKDIVELYPTLHPEFDSSKVTGVDAVSEEELLNTDQDMRMFGDDGKPRQPKV